MKKSISILLFMLLLALTVLPLAANATTMPAVSAKSDSVVSSAAEIADDAYPAAGEAADNGEVAADGINTNVVTVWIIVISAAVAIAIITATVILAKKNKNA